MRVVAWFLHLHKAPLLILAGALIVGIGLIDYLTGPQMSWAIFHLFPIILVCWGLGRFPGLLMATVAALVWLLVDLADSQRYAQLWLPYWNAAVRFGFFGVIVILLSGLKELRTLSREDSLTGIANRLAFQEAVASEIERSHRYRRPFSVAFLDCDDFKQVNDQFGHMKGDALLCQLAGHFRLQFRSNDVVARLGGDEFAMLLPETGAVEAKAAFARLPSRRFDAPSVTFSIGLVTFLSPPASVEEVLRVADECMYLAKRDGKNRLVHFEAEAGDGLPRLALGTRMSG